MKWDKNDMYEEIIARNTDSDGHVDVDGVFADAEIEGMTSYDDLSELNYRADEINE